MLDALRALPQWGVLLGLVIVIVLIVVAAAALLALLAPRPAEPSDGPSLAEQAEPLLRARRGQGQLDTQFDRLVEGTRTGLSSESAAGLVLLGGAVGAAVAYIPTLSEFLAGVAALFGGALVFVGLVLLRNRRRAAIQEQLPDGCFQLSRSLRSGLDLPLALRETSRYLPDPLSGLFARLSTALLLGEAAGPAVRRIADDTRVTDFDLLGEVLALSSEEGGNLPVMLDRLASSIRDRNQFRGYFRSVTALSRTTAFFLILAAPGALLLYLVVQPDLLVKFVTMREGQYILAAAAVLELLGILWIAAILRRGDTE